MMCIYVQLCWVHVHEHRCPWRPEVLDAPGAGVIGGG